MAYGHALISALGGFAQKESNVKITRDRGHAHG